MAYIFPEQTGRMNRAVDYRTNFYSLGATFYHLLTGKLPFQSKNAMELVHCHIAKQPIPPHALRADIPQQLSEILMKLMAKNAEERYQSAYGLKADLEECYRQLQSKEHIFRFPLGQQDFSDLFQVVQKLYGRGEEIKTLLDVKGLAEAVSVEYKFVHDRLQQAVYSLIPEADKQAVHWQVGNLLLQSTPEDRREQKIFDLVNQLNLGWKFTSQPSQRYELAQLNLAAGKKAKASAAYKSALNYFEMGLSLLGEDSWQQKYNLSLALYVQTIEAAYLNDLFDRTEELAAVVIQKANTVSDKVKVYQVRIRAYCNNNHQLLKAIEIGQEILEQLGINLPNKPKEEDINRALEKTESGWSGKVISELIDLPPMKVPEKLAAMSILSELIHPTYESSPQLYCLIALSMVDLSLKYGNTTLSAVGYANYGTVLCGISLEIDSGYQFGQLALNLVEKLNAKEIKISIVTVFCCFISPWKKHLRETLKPVLEAYQLGIEIGDFQFGSFGAYIYSYDAYWIGKELGWLEREIAKYSNAMSQINQEHFQTYQDRYWQVVLNLRGQSENPWCLIGKVYDEEKMLPIMMAAKDRYSICELYLQKFILCYLFQELPQALEYAAKVEEYLDGVLSMRAVANFYFYDSLARLAVFTKINSDRQQAILTKVAVNQKKMAIWANYAPMNFLHQSYLVEAERARVLGDNSQAREYYDRAIILAQENEYLNEEALAWELAGRFYLARGQNHVARHYLQDARYTYQK